MKRYINCAFLALVTVFVGSSVAEIPQSLRLRVDEQQRISFPDDVRSATPNDPGVIGLQGIGERDLIIRGVREGTATVSYELRAGARGVINVTVGEGSILPIAKGWLDERLRDVMGVESIARESLGRIEVKGTVRNGEQYDHVVATVGQAETMFPGVVINSVKFVADTDFAEEVILEFLRSRDISNPSVMLGMRERNLRVMGNAYSQNDKTRVEQGLPLVVERLRLGDVNIDNRIAVNDSTIEIELQFFQMSDGVVRELGADLLNNIGLNFQAVGNFADGLRPEYAAVMNVEIGKIINMLEENGKAETLHSTTVTTANGVEGSSQFGETVVIVKRGDEADAVEEIDIGHMLKVTPTLRSRGEVSLKIVGEVSELGSLDTDSNARIIRNRFDNTLNVPLGSGVVTAVHKSDRLVKSSSGTPIVRHIPIVNWVFGKERYEKANMYRGFIITPRLQHQTVNTSDNVSAETDAIIAKIRARMSKN